MAKWKDERRKELQFTTVRHKLTDKCCGKYCARCVTCIVNRRQFHGVTPMVCDCPEAIDAQLVALTQECAEDWAQREKR